MFNKLKQFNDLRDQSKKLQDVLSKESITVRAAGDKIVMTMDGNLGISALAIDDELLSVDKKRKITKWHKRSSCRSSKENATGNGRKNARDGRLRRIEFARNEITFRQLCIPDRLQILYRL